MRKRAGIKELRQYRGMTQGDLAGMIGVSPQALQRWETGKRTPKKDTLDRIYNALGVCDIITIGNPNDTPASEIVGDNVSVDVQEDEEVYSVTKKELMAMAYDVMDDLLYTCASKDEMMVMNFALSRLITEITGGNEDE
ncbi:XRE family transcriptional regulator [Coprococcus sp. AF19-8AC]|uniref:helix-turn-helix domain-containing protein n=1 Tax=Coprococcus sp. AF19-8AC TaxID=2293090 RepID=UPI000E712BD6|nr:helix-turn-helix transcriptional regulator [Coprococcus sp. AF19-8AC]RJV44255.1 XRE family transcriptional regulator [Coprococcus sp. AF19-8AC]